MPRRALWLGLLLVAVCALYAIGLGRNPVYLHEAEVLFALHARSIVTTAHDTNGRFLPLYFQMPSIGENVWFHPVIVYWMTLFLGVLPMTEWAVRLPSVVVGLIDVVLMYAIGRRLFRSPRWGLLAATLLALTPAHFIHSRVAMDYLYPVPFVMAWLLCLLIFLERRKTWILFLATSFLGVGFYSYIASVIMMPVYLLMTWMVVRPATSSRSPRLFIVSGVGFLWPLVLLVVWLSLHPAVAALTVSRYQIGQTPAAAPSAAANESMFQMLERTRRSVRFSELTGRMSLYWYFFDPAYLFVTGGYANIMNSTRHVGVFLAPLLVFVPIGLVQLTMVRQSPIDRLLVLGFLSAPLAACLVVPEPYAVDPELGILPFGVLAATVGVKYMVERGQLWRTVALGLLAFVPVHFALFCIDYFVDYPLHSDFWFGFNRRGAIEEILARDGREHPPAIYLNPQLTPSLDGYWRLYLIKHHREDLLQRTRYYEADTLDVSTVPAGSLLLASRQDAAMDKLVAAGELETVAVILEPGDPPAFAVLRR
jgi:4-amino-4-deoxy-L-arabinose transferase-like glycosyltransferase